MQRALQNLGYYRGKIDGDIGSGTLSAVRSWARDRGWEPPSSLKMEHIQHMENELKSSIGVASPSASPSRSPVIEMELSPSESHRLQSALKQLGYYEGRIDGKIGSESRYAIEKWARARGWEPPETIRTAHVEHMEKELGTTQALKAPSSDEDGLLRLSEENERLHNEIREAKARLDLMEERIKSRSDDGISSADENHPEAALGSAPTSSSSIADLVSSSSDKLHKPTIAGDDDVTTASTRKDAEIAVPMAPGLDTLITQTNSFRKSLP
ncbi:peptidoglycan-binding domain-containing protein [Jiella pelagia]|uniref:Peptidoglycan-binding domain-containing protein n=1 Tax=Jiella pelagia TaxID=2986949 RepID=A0ABY7C4V9_9HYPH|nr:peptidoglycan-binding domain-containing protein [Jiella pelagia]